LHGEIPKKHHIFILAGIIILFVILTILLFSSPKIKLKYNPLDVITHESTSLPMDIYYNQNKIFLISGWESKLQYDNNELRVSGNLGQKETFEINGKNYSIYDGSNKIEIKETTQTDSIPNSWFYNNQFNILEQQARSNKIINVSLLNGQEINSANYNYLFYKNEPFFKIQFSAKTNNTEKLGEMAYGISLKDYNILLPNGTIKLNDNGREILEEEKQILFEGKETTSEEILNKIPEEDKEMISRSGSTFISKEKYQIFFKKEKAIIIYSPKIIEYKNSFYWNVYWAYVNEENGIYSPLYLIVLENPEFEYENGWNVKSKHFSGNIEEYINKSVETMN
jgi:hypothetical protein